MTRLTLLLMLCLAALPAMAQDRDPNSEFCVALTKAMVSIMEARQAGVPRAVAAAASEDGEFKSAVNMIYAAERGRNAEERLAITRDFALLMYASCMDDKTQSQ